MKLIWKLLRKHISVFELAVFFVANLIGMAVILAGVQIYSDFSPMLTGDKPIVGSDYMVISRPIERVGNDTPKITAEEIEAAFDELQKELEEEIAERMKRTHRSLLENFDEEVLEQGSMKCPNCGETLEFSFDDEDEE